MGNTFHFIRCSKVVTEHCVTDQRMDNMKSKTLTSMIYLFSLGVLLVTSAAFAQNTDAKTATGTVTGGETVAPGDARGTAATAASPQFASAPSSPENTLATCTDKADNDRDSFVDCDDQDCAIFVACAQQVKSNEADTVKIFERGNLCKDGIDNDNNGLIDCHDAPCQTTRYCQREMYDYPDDPSRGPGIFFQVGLGLALPNFNWKDVRVNSQYGNRIPFDPDTGGMANFKIGVAPIPWLGFGMNLNLGGTFASNREEFISIADQSGAYKYDGYKVFGHIGGFVRIQYPAKRFTAYLDVAGGSTFARYKWRVYDGAASWSDISDDWDKDWEDDSDMLPHDTRYKQGHHFSLVLEPGFDFFVVEKKVGIGMHAWLPVLASSNNSMDNIGILFNATFIPTWRQPRQLKDEYK